MSIVNNNPCIDEDRDDIQTNLAIVKTRLARAESAANRLPGSVQLLAVSKTHSAAKIQLAVQAGQRAFAENQLQQALEKIARLAEYTIEWHFIGAVQSNKTLGIAQHFAWLHSLDRLKIAKRLSTQRPASMAPLNVCLEINLSCEAAKAGVDPAEMLGLAAAVAELPGLTLRGLMVIPKRSLEVIEQRQQFSRAHALFEQLRAQYPACDTLSMGMSLDLEAAVLEGSTLVRIGTAIFGTRQ